MPQQSWILLFVTVLMTAHANAQTSTSKAALRQSIGASGPMPGTVAPDFSLTRIDGQTVKLSDLWRQKLTIIMTGSQSCPVFRRQLKSFESLSKEFAAKVNFLIVYTIEAHPKGDSSPYTGKEWVTSENERLGLLIPQPKTMEERMKRASTCVITEKITTSVVVDTMDDKVWKAWGNAPNCAYLIGTDGRVIAAQPWMEPSALRSSIESATKSKRP